jgi:predicted peroxiredoxin
MTRLPVILVASLVRLLRFHHAPGFRTLITVFGLAIFAAASSGNESVMWAKIRAAKVTFTKTCEKLREPVLKNLKKAEETARKAGNKPLLDRIKEESDAFESKGVPPSVVATKEYQRQLRKAAEDLEEVYIQSIRAITKAGLDDEAETIEKELGEFRMVARVFHGKHYRIVKDRYNWHEARAACEKQVGHLAIVASEAENRFLTALLKAEGVQIAYIGATDEKKEGQWLWIDGTRLAYSDWDLQHGQPNNNDGKGHAEHYAAIYADRDGKWWDLPGQQHPDLRTGFIFQWD